MIPKESPFYPVLKATKKYAKAAAAAKEARADGKVTWFERVNIFGKYVGAIQAASKIKGKDLIDATEGEIIEFAGEAMNELTKEVKFTANDVINTLLIVRSISRMIEQER